MNRRERIPAERFPRPSRNSERVDDPLPRRGENVRAARFRMSNTRKLIPLGESRSVHRLPVRSATVRNRNCT
jgi:hypothetical protein